MSAKGTSSELFIRVPQIAAETAEGTPNNNATYAAIGVVSSLSIKKDGDYQDVRGLGKEDLISLIGGLNTYETQVSLTIINTDFVKRLVNAANPGTPAGTVSEPFTMVFSILLDGEEEFIVCRGSRVKDGDFTREAGKADEWTVNMIHTNISLPDDHGLTNPTFVDPVAGEVINSYSGGSNSVSWNAVPQNCKKVTVNFNRNSAPDHTIGNEDPFGTLPHSRKVTFDLTNIWVSDAIESDWHSRTARTLAVVVVTATSTLTLTAAKITAYDRDSAADDYAMIVEEASGSCLSVAIT
jgi:hypothetical protein